MTRKTRGPARLDDEQHAKLEVVRARRVDRDNAREELEVRIQYLRDTFLQEQDAALRSAVWAARDARVPAAHIKRVLNITDHRTYQRWLEGYVPAVDPFADSWFTIEPQGERDWFVRTAFAPTVELYAFVEDGTVRWVPDSLAWFEANPEFTQWGKDNGHEWFDLLNAILNAEAARGNA